MKIKFDKKTIKILCVVGIISFLILALGILLIMLEMQGTELLVLVALYEGIGVGAFCLAAIVSGKMYFHRLKAYGYEIPYIKRDYGDRLENLPRNGAAQEKSIFAKWSHIGMVVSVVTYCIFMLLNLERLIKWKFMWENSNVVFGLCSIFYSCWIIVAVVLKLQSNKYKYRDDVEIDESRKVRWSPETVVITILILSVFSFFANSIGNSMIKYVFGSVVAAERDYAYEIGNATRVAIEEYQSQNNDSSNQTYRLLCEGVSIEDFGEPTDQLQMKLAESLEVEDFSELVKKFKLADRKSKLEVHYDGDKVIVRLVEPVVDIGKYTPHYTEISIETATSKNVEY